MHQPRQDSGLICGVVNARRAFSPVIGVLFVITNLFLPGLSGCAAPKRVYRQPVAETEATDRTRSGESGSAAEAATASERQEAAGSGHGQGQLEVGDGSSGVDQPIPDWDRTSDQYQAPGMQAASLALAQIGRPYRYGGDDPSGFDCSGLVLYVYSLLDAPMPRTVSEQARMGLSVTAAEVQPGDLLFFRIDGSSVSHVGIYAGGDVFVHAPRTGQVVEQENLTNSWWRDRLVSARRVFRDE